MNREQEDRLDRQLREAIPYIDDDGFTSRVLKQLPVSRQAVDRSRAVILIGVTALATLLAYLLSGQYVNESIARLTSLPTLWLLLMTFAAGLLLSGAGLVAAVAKSR
ncbi:MAG: hypothetical protein QOH39_3021 [Verrucomicrobiota bacterium]|jgi:hypothetical protein